MASLDVSALTEELIALRNQAASRTVPDPKLNKQIMELQQKIMQRKSGSVSSPTTAMRKGGAVKKKMAQGGTATKKQQAKVKKVMGEFKEGTLHSGKNGKVVKNPKQAVAIALSVARKKK